MNKPLIDKSVDKYDANGMQQVFAIAPFGESETRAERIARLEQLGTIKPNCKSCEEFYNHPTLSPFAPSHRPNSWCRSGKRPHCTCDACF